MRGEVGEIGISGLKSRIKIKDNHMLAWQRWATFDTWERMSDEELFRIGGDELERFHPMLIQIMHLMIEARGWK
jgi:hypothetical protein